MEKDCIPDRQSRSISLPDHVPIVRGAVEGRSKSRHDRAIKAFVSQNVAIILLLYL